MKKQNVLNLIKYHAEKNDNAFRDEAYMIARYFDSIGDYQLSEYIMALLSDANTFVPQMDKDELAFFKKVVIEQETLLLPTGIKDDIVGIINAISRDIGINKFLFEGKPGTGKTESVKNIARILDRELFSLDFSSIVDSKLGQTAKNVKLVFEEINSLKQPQKAIILLDEIDAIALDRINSNDLREMGRVTSSILKELDNLNEQVVLIATTNLFKQLDKALSRRFDAVVNFDRYSKEDKYDIAEATFNSLSLKFKNIKRNMRLFKKIILLASKDISPAQMKNTIKISLAFSDQNSEFDYMNKLYTNLVGNKLDENLLHKQGFTLREMEILLDKSKSQIARDLKGE